MAFADMGVHGLGTRLGLAIPARPKGQRRCCRAGPSRRTAWCLAANVILPARSTPTRAGDRFDFVDRSPTGAKWSVPVLARQKSPAHNQNRGLSAGAGDILRFQRRCAIRCQISGSPVFHFSRPFHPLRTLGAKDRVSFIFRPSHNFTESARAVFLSSFAFRGPTRRTREKIEEFFVF